MLGGGDELAGTLVVLAGFGSVECLVLPGTEEMWEGHRTIVLRSLLDAVCVDTRVWRDCIRHGT